MQGGSETVLRLIYIVIDNEPWFVGKDAAEILGYGNSRDAIAAHVDKEDKVVIQKSEIPTLDIPNRICKQILMS